MRDTIAVSHDVAAVPFDINYVWRHGNEQCPHDELTADHIDAKTANHIRGTVQRLAMKGRSTPAPIILEKTVSNTLRMDMIRRVFPEAEFIRLERNGLDVVESSFRQWTLPVDRSYLLNKIRYFPLREWRYGLWFVKNVVSGTNDPPIWGPRYEGIEADLTSLSVAETCAIQWRKSVMSSRLSSADDTISIRYEDLGATSTVEDLVTVLGLSDPSRVLHQFNESFKRISSWPGAIPTENREACEQIVDSVLDSG